MSNLKTPVLFLIFNRPDVTKEVFEAIRKAQPPRLYVAADGPREGKEGEPEKCKEARAIIENVDWKCEVKTLFRERNLGCKMAVSSAIDWFFQNEEEGIILEDDCLPDQSFFGFCEELLARYRNDEKVMHIGGTNFQFGKKRGDSYYYFSRYNHVWGWASWRRAWKHYDVGLKDFPAFKASHKIKWVTNNFFERIYWIEKFEKCYEGKIDTWDYQWTFTIWNHNGISIIPDKNLVSNIGFSDDATHTARGGSKFSRMQTHSLIINKHPETIEKNKEADDFSFKSIYKKSFAANIFMILRRLFASKNNGSGNSNTRIDS